MAIRPKLELLAWPQDSIRLSCTHHGKQAAAHSAFYATSQLLQHAKVHKNGLDVMSVPMCDFY